MNIAINGFGRIGRAFLRAVLGDPVAREILLIKAINLGPESPEHVDLLFKYDSVWSEFAGSVTVRDHELIIKQASGEHRILLLSEPDAERLAWRALDINWVVECSGNVRSQDDVIKHMHAGAQHVLISAPYKLADVTIVPGINDHAFDKKKHTIVSLASCTTNCFAQLIKVLHERFRLTSGVMTTVHAYTNSQTILDGADKDPRRGRAAALNIIPTTTGADSVITKLFPDLFGKIQSTALRVPVPNVSLVDFSFTTEQSCTVESINESFWQASQTNTYLGYTMLPLVSSDFIENKASAVFDATVTLMGGGIGKVFAWYDNEHGYSSRMKDFLLHNS